MFLVFLVHSLVRKKRTECTQDDTRTQCAPHALATQGFHKRCQPEDAFIDSAFATGGITGLTKEEVKLYIRYITDRGLFGLVLRGIRKFKKNPLPWVEEMINAPTHTNFFENRATDYAKGALKGDWGDVWA